MAARNWAGSTVTAIGVAAVAGAAQLGVGYGLGIVAWVPATDQAGKVLWQASLAWVVWIAATSTVLGAIAAHWLHGGSTGAGANSEEREGFVLVAWRTTLALAAAVGALVILPLVGVPARAAESAQNFAPEWTASGYVGIGVIVGLVIAVAALSVRAIAANIMASALYLWMLAVFAVVDGLREGAQPLLIQLAIWKFSEGPTVRDFYVPGVLLMLVAAAVIGLAAAWPGGRRGDNRIGVAISGGAGPLVVAAAYLLAAPQFVGNADIDVSQWSAHLFAPYAVLAGVAGSVLVAAIGPKETAEEKEQRRARAADRKAAREQAREDEKRKAAEAAAQRPAAVKPADDLEEWPSTLEKEPTTVQLPAAGAGSGGPGGGAGSGAADEPKHPDADLADDAYAPARAYRGGPPGSDPDAKAYASDTVEAKPTPPATGQPGGASAPRTPLWPTPGGDAGRDDSSGGGRGSGKGRRPKR